MPTSNLAHCSFCGKDHHSARKFIAGPGVFICDVCITMCKEIIDKELTPEIQSPPRAPIPDSCPVKFELFPISHAQKETGLSEVATFVAGLPKDRLIAITTLADTTTVVWYRSSNL